MTLNNTQENILCPECGGTSSISEPSCKECKAVLSLNNKYFLLKILGENIGTTYSAIDLNNNLVVIKELSLRRVDKWKTQDLFQREGETLLQLSHSAIPKLVDEFEAGIGRNAKS